MADSKIDWFEDFLGLGYHVFDIRPTIYLIFDGKRKLANIWNKIIKYWPDDEIKMRFFEGDENYEFVLCGKSRILLTTTVFLKSLKISDHYRQFMEEYNGSASLQLAVYFPKDKKYELEIFKFKKKVTDVKFLKNQDVDEDFIISQARQKLKNPEKKDTQS
ncbi:MAG: hypothetical protein KGI28_09635 [Thaumarchaeota archaeon]|nr:hypothetical protein [Nitrososphaerota archaeon]